MTANATHTECALCSIDLPKAPIFEEELAFCCSGCHAVYRILATQNALQDPQKHPIFAQAVESGLISNPGLLEKLRQDKQEMEQEELITLHLEVEEMWCPACAEVIQLILLQNGGVKHAVIDYTTDLAAIEYSPRSIGSEQIIEQINRLGYKAYPLEDREHRQLNRTLLLRFGVAAFCALNIMMFSYPIYASFFNGEAMGLTSLFAYLSAFLSLPLITFCAWPIYRRFWYGLKTGLFGMESLVVIGASSAFAASCYELYRGEDHIYFDSMGMLILFVLGGKLIESRAKFSTKQTLLELSRALPRKGRRVSGEYVPLKEIAIGDLLQVNSGEKVVLDGEVVSGEGLLNEALMTGEALPVAKRVGSNLLGGSIVQRGSFHYRVSAKPESSTLHKIIEMIEPTLGKTQYERPADRIVRWFVPCVVALAAATYLLSSELIRALSVLLISCPCAIGIAAPLAESATLNRLAKLGVIVRNRGVLPLLGRLDLMLYDKTGTVTEGHFEVASGLEALTKEELGKLKGLCQQSSHPISQAIAEAITEPAIQTPFTEQIGKGIEGGGLKLGSASFTGQKSTSSATEVHLLINGEPAARIQLVDKIRQELPQVGERWLVSGDHQAAVEAVATMGKFDRWYAEKTPLEKQALIHEQKGRLVTFIGDGINDAPALAAADIGISVVTASDLSIQVSDVLLTTGKLSVIDQMQAIAAKGQRILKQNLFWAFFYNVIGLALALYGALNPIFAAGAMVASSIIVLLNAQRS